MKISGKENIVGGQKCKVHQATVPKVCKVQMASIRLRKHRLAKGVAWELNMSSILRGKFPFGITTCFTTREQKIHATNRLSIMSNV